MTRDILSDPAFCGRLCVTLGHSLWQVGGLALGAWAFETLSRKRRGRVERWYAVYVAALAMGAAGVGATFIAVDVPVVLSQRADGIAVVAEAAGTAEWPLGQERLAAPGADEGRLSFATSLEAATPAGAPPGATAPGTGDPSARWQRVVPWITGLYLVGVAVMLARLLRGMWAVQQLGGRARPIAEGPLFDMLQALARQWSLRVAPRLAEAEQIVVPKVVGLVRPMILLPSAAIARLPADELELILAHELAHVRRFDMWVNLLQRLAEAGLFFNPALWLISRRISALREFCCDELTCRTAAPGNGEPRTRYAWALLHVAELGRAAMAGRAKTTFPGADMSALAASGRSPSELRRRVAHLFGEPLSEPLPLSRNGLIAFVALAAMLVGPLAWQSEAQIAANAAQETAAADDGSEVEDSDRVELEPMTIVVARHVLLLGGREVVTWPELEAYIAALPDPTRLKPAFYMTQGVTRQKELYDAAKSQIWRLHQHFKFAGHSEGSLWPRSDLRYDRIESQADLVPDDSLRVDGKVVDSDGKPVFDAEVVLVSPIDESISYRTYHMELVRGRVRNRLDHELTLSDSAGRFAVYPPKDVEYYVIAMHRDVGFAYVRNDHFAENREAKLLPWSGLVTELEAEAGRRQEATLRTRVDASGNLPEIEFGQYWSDLKDDKPTRIFGYLHIPPMLDTRIDRSFPDDDGGAVSLPGAAVNLMPGETRQLGLGPLSEQQREWLEEIRRQFQQRREQAERRARDSTEEDNADESARHRAGEPFELTVVGPDGRPASRVTVEVRSSPVATGDQVKRGAFVRANKYAAFITTDESGGLTAALPEHFSLFVVQPGYGPYVARWEEGGKNVAPPAHFTAELEDAWSAAGVVVDSEGNPIAGATVHPNIEFRKRPGDYAQLSIGNQVETDADGRWRFESVPAPLNDVHVAISHPAYMPYRASLARGIYGIATGEVPLAKITLDRGLVIEGLVTDEIGRPVVDAVVRTKFLNDIREAATDDAGRYRIVGCEPRMTRVVVSSKGRALEMKQIRVDQDMDPVNFTLQPGRRIRVRVVDSDGDPIPKTRIFFQEWRGRIDYFEFDHVNDLTDENGVWEWNEAPVDGFRADVNPPGGMQLNERPFVARDDEYVIEALPQLEIVGDVVDLGTGMPIKDFRAVWGIQSSPTHISWVHNKAVTGANGKYRMEIGREYPAHLVQIEAEGYRTATSRSIKSDERRAQVDFRLERAADVAATLLTPDGKPASSAKIALGVDDSQINVNNGDIDDSSTYAARQDADNAGRFRFPAPSGAFHVVITHPTGFAHLKSAEQNIPDAIVLTAWARAEGTYRVGRRPASNASLYLNAGDVHSYGDNEPSIFTTHYATTDANGRFVFPRVFPGKGWIGRRILRVVGEGAAETTSSKMEPVALSAGETTHFELGGVGRPVVGALTPPAGQKDNVLWSFAEVNLRIAPLEPPPEDQTDPGSAARRRQWLQTEQRRYDASPNFNASVDRDGKFRIDDVPAGLYSLQVGFHEHRIGQLSDYRFAVPPIEGKMSEEPLDLGTLQLTP